jgi:phosphoribosylamine--glycine ligase
MIMDIEGGGTGMDLALRGKNAGHTVKYWMPTRAGEKRPFGAGLVERPEKWEPWMDWADMVVLTGNNKYGWALNDYFGKGYPIFGANTKGAELELDRGVGQELMKKCGIKTIPYEVVNTVADGIALIKETGKAYAMKPWGGEADCALTYVSASPEDGIFTLEMWKKKCLFKGKLMMQEKIKGIEMGVAGWFGPGGWSAAIEESFEHKKFMNDDLGENTGEMGTVIRHVRSSRLFDTVLEPVTDYLHSINYVGDCAVNCMVNAQGAWPMEFTMRLGWPDFCIRQEVYRGDPLNWMKDLIDGKDTLQVSPNVAVGVVVAHGDFPRDHDAPDVWSGYPIYGITEDNFPHLHFQQVIEGTAPLMVEGKLKYPEMMLTGGSYVLVASGSARTVSHAIGRAYGVVNQIKIPSNMMYRTDIGCRLEKQLPALHKLGYAEGMTYG